MFATLAFIIGLVLVLRGQFRFNNRTITAQRGRLMGLILMSPFMFQFCYSFVSLSESVNVLPDGTVSMNQDDVYAVIDNLSVIQLVTVVAAVGIVIFMIYTTPQSAPQTAGIQHPMMAGNPITPRVPDILTVSEAAAYLRVSETEVMRLIDDGRLPAARIGDSYRIARIAIEDFLKPDR